ncbi:hypothetical protein PLESTB_000509600 [Pleodorina starrii]|uniref:Cytochrome P450 n=1 Tax=Pleodorina starrii TaxID=330485 RepID=A0A9W6BG99_9CHLO|nr:hypothetical protein PLESTM_000124300 [Pleodorina starrii]GLC51504.1 hypothetical protein PLESTB_000509600 [Pleodorina starrii]
MSSTWEELCFYGQLASMIFAPKYDLPRVPGPPGSFALGNITAVMRPDYHVQMLEWANQYGGVYKFSLGFQWVVVVSDPRVAVQVLGRGPGSIPRKCVGYKFFDLATNAEGAHSFFTTSDEAQWAAVRKAAAAGFSSANVRKAFPIALRHARLVASSLDPSAPPDPNNPYTALLHHHNHHNHFNHHNHHHGSQSHHNQQGNNPTLQQPQSQSPQLQPRSGTASPPAPASTTGGSSGGGGSGGSGGGGPSSASADGRLPPNVAIGGVFENSSSSSSGGGGGDATAKPVAQLPPSAVTAEGRPSGRSAVPERGLRRGFLSRLLYLGSPATGRAAARNSSPQPDSAAADTPVGLDSGGGAPSASAAEPWAPGEEDEEAAAPPRPCTCGNCGRDGLRAQPGAVAAATDMCRATSHPIPIGSDSGSDDGGGDRTDGGGDRTDGDAGSSDCDVGSVSCVGGASASGSAVTAAATAAAATCNGSVASDCAAGVARRADGISTSAGGGGADGGGTEGGGGSADGGGGGVLADIQEHLELSMLHVFVEALFDIQPEDFPGRQVAADMNLVLEEANERLKVPLRKVAMALRQPMAQARVRAAQLRLAKVYGNMYDTIRSRGPPADGLTDLWAGLARLRHPSSGSPLSRSQLVPEIGALMMAGFDTSSHSVAWVLFALASWPEVQQRVRGELEARGLVAGADGSPPRDPSLDDLSQLPYLNAVIDETMRMFPVAATASVREVTQPTRVGDYVIPPGVIVWPMLYALHNSVHNWDRPEEFRPERWLAAGGGGGAGGAGGGGGSSPPSTPRSRDATAAVSETEAPPGETAAAATAASGGGGGGAGGKRFMPFSDGMKSCLGQALGLMEVRTMLVVLLGRYVFQLDPSMGGLEAVRRNMIMSLTLKIKGGLRLLATPLRAAAGATAGADGGIGG